MVRGRLNGEMTLTQEMPRVPVYRLLPAQLPPPSPLTIHSSPPTVVPVGSRRPIRRLVSAPPSRSTSRSGVAARSGHSPLKKASRRRLRDDCWQVIGACAKEDLMLWSIAAHVSESLVRDSHQVRDFVHDDVSQGGHQVGFGRCLSFDGGRKSVIVSGGPVY